MVKRIFNARQKGVTLIEVVIGLTVFMIVAIATFTASMNMTNINHNTIAKIFFQREFSYITASYRNGNYQNLMSLAYGEGTYLTTGESKIYYNGSYEITNKDNYEYCTVINFEEDSLLLTGLDKSNKEILTMEAELNYDKK